MRIFGAGSFRALTFAAALILGVAVFLYADSLTAGPGPRAATGPRATINGLPVLNGPPVATSRNTEALPERVIVKYRDTLSAQDFRTALVTPALSGRMRLVRSLSMFGRQFDVVEPRPGVSAASLVSELAARPGVEYAQIDHTRHITSFTPNDPYFTYQWHFQETPPGSVDMLSAWQDLFGRTFPTVIVAVVDTGVAYENYSRFKISPDFVPSQFVSPYNFVANTTHANDDEGHGTHVSGTIAEQTDNGVGVAGIAGMLPNVKIMPVKVLDQNGSGSDSNVAAGINWAVDHGANIINMSLGGAGTSQVISDALAYAAANNVLAFCAAGNDYQNGNPVEYPAADPNCVAVGALDYAANRAYYSNTGSYVELAAPGGDANADLNNDGYPDGVLQLTFSGGPSNFGYYFYTGTSMATPHATGTAAVIWSLGLTNAAAVRQLMDSTARDLGTPGRDDEYGFGQVNMGAILSNFPEGGVNTTGDDHGLFASADGSALFFKTAGLVQGLTTSGLLVADKDPVTHEFLDPVALDVFTPAEAAVDFPNGHALDYGAVSADQLELYVTVWHGSSIDIWYGTRASMTDPWGTFAPLPFTQAEPAKFGTPFLSSDGLTLYFASDRPCAACVTDEANIWYATRTSGQPPADFAVDPASETVLAAINTHASSAADPANYNETFPSLTSDGLKIVYASDAGSLPGATTQGWIFEAQRASTAVPFGTPVELGSGINTGSRNFTPFLAADGKTLYFASSRAGGMGHGDVMFSNNDHGAFTPPQFLPPDPAITAVVCGLVPGAGATATAAYLAPFIAPLILLFFFRRRLKRVPSYARVRIHRG